MIAGPCHHGKCRNLQMLRVSHHSIYRPFLKRSRRSDGGALGHKHKMLTSFCMDNSKLVILKSLVCLLRNRITPELHHNALQRLPRSHLSRDRPRQRYDNSKVSQSVR